MRAGMDVKDMAKLGGKARARKLGRKKLSEQASKAARARWHKVKTTSRVLPPRVAVPAGILNRTSAQGASLTLERIDSDVAEYLALLDSRTAEARVHDFLASHSYFFHLLLLDVAYPYPLYTKIRLGGEYETDFVSFITSSFGAEWRFAEIESPKCRLFTRGGDPTAPLTHAMQQVQDWIRWCDNNIAFARTFLPGLLYPMAFVFLGRRSELTPTTAEKIRQINSRQTAFRIRTLDAFAAGATAVKYFVGNGEWKMRFPMNALSDADLRRGVSPEALQALNWPIPEEFTKSRRDHRIWDFDEPGTHNDK